MKESFFSRFTLMQLNTKKCYSLKKNNEECEI